MLLLSLASFASVFFKGLQQQNIIGGKYKAAFFVSYVMALLDVFVVTNLINNNSLEAGLMIGLGASAGVVTSMLVYRRVNSVRPVC